MALTTRLPSTKVEPFHGFVETTGDALRLIHAARQGLIPRTTRRLNDLERRDMVRSGAIFVFSDEESGIKRWTEGLSWSASRIVGNFLVYREVTDRAHARCPPEGRRTSRRRGNANDLSPEQLAEQKLSRSLVGCLSDSNGRYKVNGLIKKTITIGVGNHDHHLIAYYKQEDVKLGKLQPLSSRADIMSLEIPPELLESTKFRIPPVIDNGPDGRPRYVCDADEGLAEQISLPFPSISRTTLSYQRVTPTRPRLSQPIVTPSLHSLHSPNTPIEQPGTSYHCNSSPSACSTASSTSIDTDGINWFSASTTMGNLWSSPPAHAFGASGTTADEITRALHPQLPSIPTPTNAYTSQNNGTQSALSGNATTGLLPAWNAGGSAAVAAGGHHVHAQVHNQSHGHDSYGTYALSGAPDTGFVSPEGYMVASGSAQQRGTVTPLNVQIPHQTYPHDHSPSIYSSLPATPTQPRHSQRFTSLPTIYTTTICEAAAISPLELSPRVDGEEWHIAGPSATSVSPLNHSSMHIAAWP